MAFDPAGMMNALAQRLRAIPFEGRTALLCLPVLVATLGYGVVTGDVIASSIVTSGALAVGFGSVHAFTRHRWAAMLLAAIGMAISTFVGSRVGNHEIAFILTAALWTAACAMFATIEFGAWWIILQWTIALLVAGYFPADLEGAATRSGLVLAGGLLQLSAIVIAWRLRGGAPPPGAHHSIRRIRKSLRLARHGKLPTMRHAARAAISVALASSLVHWLELPNGYWAAMTALIVLKPQLRATRTRGLERLVGTLAGAGVATLITLLHPPATVLLVLTVTSAWLAFGLQRSRYIPFTVAITATIVFVLALEHQPGAETAWHRLLATAIGGAIALTVAFITSPGKWPKIGIAAGTRSTQTWPDRAPSAPSGSVAQAPPESPQSLASTSHAPGNDRPSRGKDRHSA